MKKNKIIMAIVISLFCLSNNAFSIVTNNVTLNSDPNNTNKLNAKQKEDYNNNAININKNAINNENKSTHQTGVINDINLNTKTLIVNREAFKLADDYKVYDGKLEKGKFIRFLFSSKKQIIDIWIIK